MDRILIKNEKELKYNIVFNNSNDVEDYMKGLIMYLKSFLTIKFLKDRDISDIYFDTEKLDFFENDRSMRLRHEKDGSKLTIKLPKSTEDSVMSRHEINIPIYSSDFIDEKLLKPLFEVQTKREVYEAYDEQMCVKLCIDKYQYDFEGVLSEIYYQIEFEDINYTDSNVFSDLRSDSQYVFNMLQKFSELNRDEVIFAQSLESKYANGVKIYNEKYEDLSKKNIDKIWRIKK